MKFSVFIITFFMYSVSIASDDLPVESPKERFISSLYNPHNEKECAATMLRANLALASKQCFEGLLAGYHLSDLAIYTSLVNLAPQCVNKREDTYYYDTDCSSYPLQSVEVAGEPGNVVVLKIGGNPVSGDGPLKELENKYDWLYALETVDQYQQLSNKQESSLYTVVLRDGNLDTARSVTYEQNSTRYDEAKGLVFSVVVDDARANDWFLGMPVYSTRCSDVKKTPFLQGIVIAIEWNKWNRGARLIVQSQAEHSVLTAIEDSVKQDEVEHVLFINSEHRNSNTTSDMSLGSLALPFRNNATALAHIEEHEGAHLLSYLNRTIRLVPNQNDNYAFPANRRILLINPEREVRMRLQRAQAVMKQEDHRQNFRNMYQRNNTAGLYFDLYLCVGPDCRREISIDWILFDFSQSDGVSFNLCELISSSRGWIFLRTLATIIERILVPPPHVQGPLAQAAPKARPKLIPIKLVSTQLIKVYVICSSIV